jgi:preprotein translocase subunit YajC
MTLQTLTLIAAISASFVSGTFAQAVAQDAGSAAPAGPNASAAPAPSKAVGMPAAPSALPAAGSAGSVGVPAGGVPATQQQSSGSMLPIFMLVAMGILFIPMIFAGRREAKKKAELIASIKKGDQIQTAGGIIGFIHDINPDDVVLRLEDGRMRVAKSAVIGVLKAASAKAESVEAKPAGKPVEV